MNTSYDSDMCHTLCPQRRRGSVTASCTTARIVSDGNQRKSLFAGALWRCSGREIQALRIYMEATRRKLCGHCRFTGRNGRRDGGTRQTARAVHAQSSAGDLRMFN
ncbi:uncharacterized protein O9250_008010 isoform 4-T24 [Rhynochetos jubatus]